MEALQEFAFGAISEVSHAMFLLLVVWTIWRGLIASDNHRLA